MVADDRSGSAVPQPPLSFDRVAHEYDETRGGVERGDRHAAAVLEHLDGNARCLEIGVGTGAVALGVVRRGLRVCGVDVSTAMLRHAAARLGHVVVAADARRLPVRDASIAQAYSVWLLHLVDDLATMLAEVARVLRRGGCYVVIPAGGQVEDEGDPVARLVADLERRLLPDVEAGPRPSIERLRTLGAAAGLELEAVDALPTATYEESPEQTASNLERRTFSMCWPLDDEGFAREVAPVVAALRALPDTARLRRRRARREVIAILRRA